MSSDPQRPDPAPRTDDESAPSAVKKAFGEWFSAELERRGLRNNAMIALLDSVGANGRYKSSDISNLKNGTKRPGETGAALFAAALGLPEPLVLRKAGYEDTAAFRERQRPDEDRLLTTIRGSGLPETEQRDLENQLSLMEELILLKIEKLRRATEPTENGQQDAS
jgi:hypothetical protein